MVGIESVNYKSKKKKKEKKHVIKESQQMRYSSSWVCKKIGRQVDSR